METNAGACRAACDVAHSSSRLGQPLVRSASQNDDRVRTDQWIETIHSAALSRNIGERSIQQITRIRKVITNKNGHIRQWA
jgi:hypothetical protein